MNNIGFAATLAALLLTSCAITRPVHYYTLTPTAAASSQTKPDGPTILIGAIATPEALQDGRIRYRAAGHESGSYEYHRWEERPGMMVRDSLVRALRASGQFGGRRLLVARQARRIRRSGQPGGSNQDLPPPGTDRHEDQSQYLGPPLRARRAGQRQEHQGCGRFHGSQPATSGDRRRRRNRQLSFHPVLGWGGPSACCGLSGRI